MKQAIAIFSKPPIPGHTKSRLAADTSNAFAAELSGAMLSDLLNEVNGVCATSILFYPPEFHVGDFSGIGPLADTTMVQEGNDLGERMLNCLRRLLEVERFDRVVIIGSDCIAHSSESLTQALASLTEHEVVVQPADDGGYVLIGATRPIPALFANIDWGTDTVWEQTRRALEKGIDHGVLPISFDVDDTDDLDRLRLFCELNPRPNTEAVLNAYS